MDIVQYFEPYEPGERLVSSSNERLNSYVNFWDEKFEGDASDFDVYIMGVQEGRLAFENETCAFAPDEIRGSLYKLFQVDWSLRLLDLGNLKLGNQVKDTYVALEDIVSQLVLDDKIVLVLGGGHDLINPIFKGHCKLGNPLSFASADAYLDFQDGENYHSKSFLSKLVTAKETLLSKYTLLGYQSYLCSPTEVSLLEQMDFNLIRLGELKADVKEVEPYVRNVDHLSIDASVVNASHFPANPHASPNGINAEDLCAIMRYAGMSNQLKTVLFSELHPRLDVLGRSAMVYAQAIWYLIEGLHLRKDDFPDLNFENFQKFHVSIDMFDLVFYKSKLSERWWMEVPEGKNVVKRQLIPCSLLDYKKAVEGVLTERLVRLVKF
jgi:arginase family enzyme